MLDIHIKYYYVLLFTYELQACVQQYNEKAKLLPRPYVAKVQRWTTPTTNSLKEVVKRSNKNKGKHIAFYLQLKYLEFTFLIN